jgi:hypothetical protein
MWVETAMTTYYNRWDYDPLSPGEGQVNTLQKLIDSSDALDKSLDALAKKISECEKMSLIDFGEIGGTHEGAEELVRELKKRGCKAFVHQDKILAWGEAYEKVRDAEFERMLRQPIPIEPLESYPEQAKLIWSVYGRY